MSSAETSNVAPTDILQPNKCVAIIYTMADFQSMDKPSWIKTCKDLSAHFIAFIHRKYDELHIRFDGYDIQKSLKVSKVAKIRNRYNQVPNLTQDTNGKVTNSQKTPQTRAKRSALSQQVTTKHI